MLYIPLFPFFPAELLFAALKSTLSKSKWKSYRNEMSFIIKLCQILTETHVGSLLVCLLKEELADVHVLFWTVEVIGAVGCSFV